MTAGLIEWHQLHWVLCSNIKHDVGQKLISCTTIHVSFPVHELIKVARSTSWCSWHLEFDFDSIPVGLDILGVDPSGTVHKQGNG